MGDGFNPAVIVFKRNVLVRSVRVFIRQAEADQHAGNLEGVMHLGDEGDGAALANEDGFFPESLFERTLRDRKDWRVERGYPRFAGAEHLELALDRLRQELANLFFDELRNGLRLLVGSGAGRKICVGFRRDYRLCALTLITSPHAVQLEGWPRP